METNGEHLKQLRETIEAIYNLNSLRGLAHDLDIDYEQLEPGPFTTKVVSLIATATRTGKLEQLEQLVRKAQLDAAPIDPDETPPYQGLNYFDVGDTDRYFGRDALITDLINRINDEKLNFLMVVGASGSGKSSLVRAGLIPTLQGNRPQQADTELPKGSKEWPLHLITPSAHPLTELASSLTRDSESVTATTTLIDDLKKDSRSLSLYARRLLDENKTDQKLLLVVDQFEETFTASQDEEERKAFIENLMVASQPETDCPILVICTLRADFYHRCLHYDSFRAILETSQANIGPMSREELQEAIEGPATAEQWELDAGLVETILNDIDDEPGALPLLSHALLATWENRKDRALTVGGYQEAGGVKGAIRNTADKFYNSQKEKEGQDRVKQIFIRLATLGEGQADTRRRVSLDWLLSIDGEQPEQIQTLLKELADQRLITTSENSVEISHEALLREWPQLREWLDDNRDLLRLYHVVADSADTWEKHGKESSYLFSGVQLAQIVDREDELIEFINPLEQALITSSKQSYKNSIRVRWGAAIASIVAIIYVVTLLSLSNAQKSAIEVRDELIDLIKSSERELRNANQQLIESEAELDTLKKSIQASGFASNAKIQFELNSELALMLAIVGYQLSYQQDTSQELFKIVNQMIDRQTLSNHTNYVRSAVFSPKGDLVLTGSGDGTAKLWDLDGKELVTLIGHSNFVRTAEFNLTGDRILTGSGDHTAKLWNLNGEELVTFTGHSGIIRSAVFNSSGDLILTASEDKTAKLWKSDGAEIATLFGHDEIVRSALFNLAGNLILTASEDNTAKLWNVDGKELITFKGHASSIRTAVFNPKGDLVLTASGDGTAKLWSLNGDSLATFVGHTDAVDSAIFSPSGDRVLTASWDGTAKLWNLDGEELASLDSHSDIVTSARFDQTGDRILTASGDGTAKLWSLNGEKLLVFSGHTEYIRSAEFNSTGDRVLTASWDGTAKLWSLNKGKLISNISSKTNTAIFNSKGDHVLATYVHGQVTLWNLRKQELITFTGLSEFGKSVFFNPNGDRIILVEGRKAVSVWNLSGKKVVSFISESKYVEAALFNPTGDQILIAYDDGSLKLLNLSGKELATFTPYSRGVRKASFSPDGNHILTIYFDGALKIWNLHGEELTHLMDYPNHITTAVFNPTGNLILTGSGDGIVKLWNLDGKELAAFIGHSESIHSVVFNPAGDLILTASSDQTAKLWDSNGNELVTFKGHTIFVRSAIFNPDADRILTAGGDGLVKIWNLDGEELGSLPIGRHRVAFKNANEVSSAVFNPTGDRILTSSGGGEIEIWFSDSNLLTLAEMNVFRGFTDEECQLYFKDEPDLCPQTVEALFSMGESSQ